MLRLLTLDGRFGITSYFNTILFEYVPQIPLNTNDFISTGVGGTLYVLNYTHYLYDENGEPENPEKSDVSHYGFYGGWSLFADVMILQSLTLHTDFIMATVFITTHRINYKIWASHHLPFDLGKSLLPYCMKADYFLQDASINLSIAPPLLPKHLALA